jgi:hypothetical protein
MQLINMQKHLLLIIGFLLPIVLCDTIKINSPTLNQVINNSSFLIDYIVERNDNNSKLFITNSTTELLDVKGNSLVAVPRNFTNFTMVRLDMRTFVQPNTFTNFTVKITAFGKYDNQTFGEIKLEVPLQLNLSNGTVSSTTSKPTSSTTSKPTSTSTTSASSETTAPTTTSTNKSNGSSVNNSNMVMGLTSFLVLFLL